VVQANPLGENNFEISRNTLRDVVKAVADYSRCRRNRPPSAIK
jgi:hypothetical protein